MAEGNEVSRSLEGPKGNFPLDDPHAKAEWPSECADCDMTVLSDAEAFLHAVIHAEQEDRRGDGGPTLRSLPYVLYRAVAEVMREYKVHV